jgi:YHS domain-containing protein
VLRPLLLLLLVMFFARAVWRLLEGVVRGAIGPQGTPQARREPAPRAVKMARDPVCGTYVVPEKALTLTRGGQPIYFCSEDCRSKYDR